MVRLIKRDRGNYTNVSNILLRDSQLSWKARGIFCYLWSQANEWQFYVAEIATHATDGVKALRSGLDELEAQGYLKRVNKHSKTGSFDGMDWILDDKGSLKKIQEDSDVNRRDHFGDDAQMAQNQPKKCQNTSDAKGVRPVKGSTQNGTLRNNNNKNYQYKELTTNKSSSSVIADPFKVNASSKEEEEDQINKLIDSFVESKQVYMTPSQHKRIFGLMCRLPIDEATDVVRTVADYDAKDPVAYLISALTNAR